MPDRLLVFPIVFALVFLWAWWRYSTYERDPEWERRWGELPISERKRLAKAGRRGELLADREEAWLAAESARSQDHFLLNSPWKRWLTAVAMLAIAALVAALLSD